MATTIWKGHIAFGLVSFPVQLQAAARSQAVSFNQLHQCDHSRVKQVLYCQTAPNCLLSAYVSGLPYSASAAEKRHKKTSPERKFRCIIAYPRSATQCGNLGRRPAKENNVHTVSTHTYCRCLLTIVTASVAIAAGPSFTGSWKINMAKSQLTGQTATIEKTASGGMHYDSEGFGYDFDLSGKEFPMPDGGTTSWREVNATTWEATNRMKGKVIATFRMTLAGDSVKSVVRMTKPDGSVTEQTGTLTRVSGGPGFLGKWKSTDVKGAPTSISIETEGQNGITLKIPEGQAMCKGSFDGKDYPLLEAGVPSKQTLSFERTGTNGFKMTTKLNGKPFYVDVFTVSADGKTLTDEGNSVSVSEPVKGVYDRQ